MPGPLDGLLDEVKAELDHLLDQQMCDLSNPAERAALVAMAHDAAMLPIRAARGEDVTALTAALSAEAQNRTLTHRVRVQQAVQAAWTRIVTRLLGAALAAL